jgi:hypothetical protein
MARTLSRAQRGQAAGPVWAGQMVTVEVANDEGGPPYRIQWLPDAHNPELREAGRPMHFYYLPNRPRLDRDLEGHYRFHLQKFSGVMDPTRNIGESGYAELAGGLLTFSMTLDFPEEVLVRAFDQLKDQLPRRRESRFLFWRGGEGDPEPLLAGPVALHENELVLHRISPENAEGGGEHGPDDWAFEIQGAEEGGSLNVQASNSFTVMLGSRPVQMLLASAESGTSQVTVESRFSYYVQSLVTEIEVTGSWDSVYDHFSGQFRGGIGPFTPLDLQGAIDQLVQNQAIKVRVNFGEGLVDADDRQTYLDAATSIADAFRNQIGQRLEAALREHEGGEGDPAAAEKPEEASQARVRDHRTGASRSRGGWLRRIRRLVWVPRPRLSLALKASRDRFRGEFRENWEITGQILRDDVVASQMDGLFTTMASDPTAMDRYFSEVFFEEGFQKIHVVARANANWGDGERPGDPIHTVNLQVGYPDSRGNLQWKSAARYKNSDADPAFSEEPQVVSWTQNTRDRLYAFDFTRHDEPGEVVRLKNIIRFRESPDVAVQEVESEEETDTHVVEVRASSAGNLRVGPIQLDMPIGPEDSQISVVVRVRTRTFGEKAFSFDSESVGKERVYSVWYARPEDVEAYEYKVEVVVRGRRFGQPPLRWEGNWTQRDGSGPLLAVVPPVPAEHEEAIDQYLAPA